MAHPFERLHAWQLAHRLTLQVYTATASFPRTEQYGLTAQLRRAASSAAANIAEGSIAASRKEFARFLNMARRSLNEVGYWLILARDLAYLTEETCRDLTDAVHHTGRTTWALERHQRGA